MEFNVQNFQWEIFTWDFLCEFSVEALIFTSEISNTYTVNFCIRIFYVNFQ